MAQVLDLSTVPPIEIGVSWPGFTLTFTDAVTGQPPKFISEPGWEFQSDIKYPNTSPRYRVNVVATSDNVLAFTMVPTVTQRLERVAKVDWDFLLKTPQGVVIRDYEGVLDVKDGPTVWQ